MKRLLLGILIGGLGISTIGGTIAIASDLKKGSIRSAVNQIQEGITLEEAQEVALEEAGYNREQVTFTKSEIDYEKGKYIYEIEFISQDKVYKYEITVQEGKVILKIQKNVTEEDKITDSSDLIGLEVAKKKALEYVGISNDEVIFTKARLDHDDGTAKYDIEFVVDGKEYELEIQGIDGKVLEYDVDYDE